MRGYNAPPSYACSVENGIITVKDKDETYDLLIPTYIKIVPVLSIRQFLCVKYAYRWIDAKADPHLHKIVTVTHGEITTMRIENEDKWLYMNPDPQSFRSRRDDSFDKR